MASISHKEVEHVAQLARLDLTEPEKTLFGEQLNQILTFVEQLQEVPTEGIPLTASVADQELLLREDLPREGLSQEQALKNAPEASEGFLVVPKAEFSVDEPMANSSIFVVPTIMASSLRSALITVAL